MSNRELTILGKKIVDLEERQGFICTTVEEIEDQDLTSVYGIKEAIYGYYAALDQVEQFRCRISECLRDQLVIDKRLMAITSVDGEHISINSIGLKAEAFEILILTNRRVILCADHILPSLVNPRYVEAPKKLNLSYLPANRNGPKKTKSRKK